MANKVQKIDLKRRGRCVCGLRLALHFNDSNHKLSCDDAAKAHRFARIEFTPLRELMLKSIEVGR